MCVARRQVDQNGIEAVIFAMKAIEEDPSVQQFGAFAVANLCQSPAHCRRALKATGNVRLVSAMKDFPDHDGV
jgi:hypothetical protein